MVIEGEKRKKEEKHQEEGSKWARVANWEKPQ